MATKWTLGEAQSPFRDWSYGEYVPDFDELAGPGEIRKLTVVARAFLRRRQSLLHPFSPQAVNRVRGTTGLASVALAHNPLEDTFLFTRTYEPRDVRFPIDDETYPMQRSQRDPLEELEEEVFALGYDLEVRRDTFFRDAYVLEQSNTTRVYSEAKEPEQPVRAENEFLIEDYMVLRMAMHAESSKRLVAA